MHNANTAANLMIAFKLIASNLIKRRDLIASKLPCHFFIIFN